MVDYSLWDIIENGNSILKTQTVNNVETVIPLTTADEKYKERMRLKQEGVNTANGVNTASSQVNVASSLNIDNLSDAVICAFLASQPNSTQLVNEDLEQIHPDNLEEMDLKWECRAPRGQDNMSRDVTRKIVLVDTPNSLALVSCDGLGGYDFSDQVEEGPTNYALMAYSTPSASSLDSEVFNCSKSCLKVIENLKSTNEKIDRALTELQKRLDLAKTKKEGIKLNVNKLENASKSLNKIIECQIVDNCKKGLGYNTVPPLHTGLFPPPKSDMSSIGKNSDALIIEDWVSDDEEEKIEKKEVKPSIKRINFVKATTDNNPRETV
uniref:Uncharacterized protein n=1 Tax=Tanacetum cinerariifolium TaxID=118510 RepID=A0A6L2L9Y5_TANCI|nr:hypothetical protein [Tanacetum cinerariifolium]